MFVPTRTIAILAVAGSLLLVAAALIAFQVGRSTSTGYLNQPSTQPVKRSAPSQAPFRYGQWFAEQEALRELKRKLDNLGPLGGPGAIDRSDWRPDPGVR